MTPVEGTPEYDLWLTAIDIATIAPLKQGTNAHTAQVPWRMIHELRQRLDSLGVDWRKVKASSAHIGRKSDDPS